MISITSTQLQAWIGLLIWPFARIIALVASAPISGNQQFPVTAKIGLAMLIAMVVAPTVPFPGTFDPGGASGLTLLVRESLIGIGMGFAMRVVFAGVEAAGELIGLQMGLGFAQFYDPHIVGQTPVASQFVGLLATLVFLSVNGHLLLIATLVGSFQHAPAAGNVLGLVLWGGMVLQAAVLIALPVVAALLITNAALAVLTRAAPQLNVFAIGFPITLIVGFVALLITLPQWVAVLQRYFDSGFDAALRFAGAR